MQKFLRLIPVLLLLISCPVENGEEENTVMAPSASPADGYQFPAGGGQVTLTCGTDEASIYYTTGTGTPDLAYTVPIPVNAAVTIRAMAKKDGMTDSPIVSMSYTVDGQSGVTETAMKAVRNMKLGVNIGNTFESVGGPTSWGNPGVTRNYIRSLKTHGFTTVRFPVTWAENIGEGPDYTVNLSWLQQVQQVVQWILAEDMYCILNVHHDGADINGISWIEEIRFESEEAHVKAKFEALWRQIAVHFRNSSDKLVFEGMNEPQLDKLWPRNNPNITNKTRAFKMLTDLNQLFVDTVRGTGGNNETRLLLVPGYWTDIDMNVNNWGDFFFMPTDTEQNGKNKLILSLHYFSPWGFCGGNSTTWGTTANINELNTQFNKVKENFIDKGIPVIIGEYAVNINTNDGAVTGTPKNSANRVAWMLGVTQACVDMGVCPVLWDTGMRANNKGMADIQRQSPFAISDDLSAMINGVVWPAVQ